MKFNNRKLIKIAVIIISPISILAILDIIMIFTAGNMFTQEFIITNGSDKVIQITPFGKFKDGNEYNRLGLYYFNYPSISRLSTGNISINPKKSKKIFFDSDGMYLQGLTIKTNGKIKLFLADEKSSELTITNIDELDDVDLQKYERIKPRFRGILNYCITLIGLLNIWIILRIRKRKK